MEQQIREYILEELLEGQEVSWDDDTNIISSGIIDSLSIVKLLVFVEDTFEISLDDSLDLENFQSVNSIKKIVAAKLAK